MDSAFEICYTAFLILDSGTPLPKEVKEILEETKKENNYDSLKERLRPFFNQLEVLHQEEIKKKEKELNEKKMSVNNKMKRKKKKKKKIEPTNQQIPAKKTEVKSTSSETSFKDTIKEDEEKKVSNKNNDISSAEPDKD